MPSYLDVINKVDSFPYTVPDDYYTLLAHDGSAPLGYVTPEITKFLSLEPEFTVDEKKKEVQLGADLNTFEKRNEVFAKIANSWKQKDEFEDCLAKAWRGELYTVYNPTTTPYFLVERAFSVLLGIVTYGAHINGYVSPENTSNGKLKLWVPRRSFTKPTYPGKLDNTVAGGIGYPYGIWETVLKECGEEAGLSEDFVKTHAKPNGVLSYSYQPKLGQARGTITEGIVVQPEVEYIYDLEFENEKDVVPYPEDGEAESFQLLDVDEVLQRVHNDEFKPNCGLVIIDFLIRHGYITPENEPYYMEIVSRCHRKHPFPTR